VQNAAFRADDSLHGFTRFWCISPVQALDVTLAGRIPGMPDRQATLAATLDWSHDLLADDERAVFRRLSVFAGGFALDAAEQVCAAGLSEPVAVVVSRLGGQVPGYCGDERRPGPFPAA
jgi:hypothetical protein